MDAWWDFGLRGLAQRGQLGALGELLQRALLEL
jgi:hypothetical protein